MTFDNIKEIYHNGNLLGAHSMSHNKLAHLAREQKEKEIVESKKIIQQICNNPFIPFSYPHGSGDSYDEETKKLLKENKLCCSVTTIEGLNGKNIDLYELKRINIGNFNRIELVTYLTGFVGEAKFVLEKFLK